MIKEVKDIPNLSLMAKSSLISNGYKTLEDINKAGYYKIFSLRCFKKTIKNMKIITEIMRTNGYPHWGEIKDI